MVSQIEDILPAYIEGQKAQDVLDALVLRLHAHLGRYYPHVDIRRLLLAEAQSSETDTPTVAADHKSPPDKQQLTPWQAARLQESVIVEFFAAILREDIDTLTYLVSSGIIKPGVRSAFGATPLTAALAPFPEGYNESTTPAPAPSPALLAHLIALGADPNELGTVSYPKGRWRKALRTPLMLAAERGSLPLVHLLFSPPVSADDAIVSPDGETALRLAAAGGHAAVVAFLPARRAGALRRIMAAVQYHIKYMIDELGLLWEIPTSLIWPIIKFFIWSLPKFVVWDTPKFCWKHRVQIKKLFGELCEAIWHDLCLLPKAVWGMVKEVSHVVSRAGKATWKFATQTLPRWGKKSAARVRKLFTETMPEYLKAGAIRVSRFISETMPRLFRKFVDWLWTLFTEKLPKLLKDGAVWLNKTITETIPRLSKEFASWLWTLLTERIPHALGLIANWIKQHIAALYRALCEIITSFVSLLHTVLLTVIKFLRNVTLRDVWNGLCDFFRAVFVKLPNVLWHSVENLGTVIRQVLQVIFSKKLGIFLWSLGNFIFQLAVYFPKKILYVLLRVARTVWETVIEAIICVHPKVMVTSH